MLAARRLGATRSAPVDRSLEALPLFRLSDTSDEGALSFTTDAGGRWRVLPAPGDRLPGTFDQDVYVELMRRFAEAGAPADGAITFTLHNFLRSMGRRVDGRTYEQLRSALGRLQRTTLESIGAYFSAAEGRPVDAAFSVLSNVTVERRRMAERDQLALFPALDTPEPGVARVTVAPLIRDNIAAGHTTFLATTIYGTLGSPVARRLYRLLSASMREGTNEWRVRLDRLADQLPLAQRFPSHIQRVLRPAHDLLRAAGVIGAATFGQVGRDRFVVYFAGTKSPDAGSSIA